MMINQYLPFSFIKKSVYFIAFLTFGVCQSVYAGEGAQTLSIENARLKITVSINRDGYLTGDSVFAKPSWAKKFNQRSFGVASDAGFKMSLMWTAWRAPGKSSNGDDVIKLTQHDFKFQDGQTSTTSDGSKLLIINLKGRNTPLQVQVLYKISRGDFYARRKVQVKVPEIPDHYAGKHYLRKLYPLQENLQTKGKIIKKGGFGQPVALAPQDNPQTGIFWGMEYPTAQNKYITKNGQHLLSIGDFYGKRIDTKWTSSNWVVIGLSPQQNVRRWFMRYVDNIRAQPVRPYVLYNSWYDLQSPQLVGDGNPKHVMNEKNALHSIKSLQQKLVQKRGVKLDAFVLDDGWDVYRSDWEISKKQFPHGFKPLVKQLDKTGTDLGTWFGPIGGYSHREWRVDWMKKHGYETIGNDQLCLAGKNYHKLFKKRVTDFTKNRGVGYYKWDGIQFSSSNPANGHPVGVYSRRAIMDSVIDLSRAVWKANPHAFLNITSGTWLSPWWVKYATTIWMQGGDYGYTNIPSISQRDRAITYRDFTLYNDFKTNNRWFPIANLMTHGIIKGKLQNLSVKEPLDKFTNNALLYFSRGVSMWELYVSPDFLTDDQWDVIAQGIKWAKDRFDIMQHTVMIGGNPGKGEPYGYAHFKDRQGVVIVRNPTMNPQNMSVELNQSLGLAQNSDSLVVERVYPQKEISPVLSSSGSNLDVKLKGYETAIYEIFPLKDANRPLLAGATFEAQSTDDGYQIKVLDADEQSGGLKLLNADEYPHALMNGQKQNSNQLSIYSSKSSPVVTSRTITTSGNNTSVTLKIDVASDIKNVTLATLLQQGTVGQQSVKKMPDISITVDGDQQKASSQIQKAQWGWFKVNLNSGHHTVKIKLQSNDDSSGWKGLASFWVEGDQPMDETTVRFEKQDISVPVFPPVVQPEGTTSRQEKIGSATLRVN